MSTILTEQELNEIKVGEAVTLAGVMSILAIAITAVIVYRIFKSKAGSTTMPGGWKFEWK